MHSIAKKIITVEKGALSGHLIGTPRHLVIVLKINVPLTKFLHESRLELGLVRSTL